MREIQNRHFFLAFFIFTLFNFHFHPVFSLEDTRAVWFRRDARAHAARPHARRLRVADRADAPTHSGCGAQVCARMRVSVCEGGQSENSTRQCQYFQFKIYFSEKKIGLSLGDGFFALSSNEYKEQRPLR
jgi:hypothetical protein